MRHHYIPQWLLRNFQDRSGKIYGFRKSDPARGIFTTTPKNLMVEKNFYTLRGDSEPDRQRAEKEYSRRETFAKPVADKIIAAARSNAWPRLTLRERMSIQLFHLDTWRRTPDVAAEKRENMGPFDLDAFLESYRKERNLNADDIAFIREHVLDPDTRKVIDHDARIRASAGPPTQDVFWYLADMGLGIARIANPGKSFVIGSYALAFARYRGEEHFWLPISHDVAVEPYGNAGTEYLVELNDDCVRSINEASFRESSIVAARSKRLLRSLAGRFGYTL